MILYHYPMSPFSEQCRLMLAFAGQSWLSLPCPEMPPRPGLDALAGGYRRIPVAQSGADIFCDSRLISDEIASVAGRASLQATGRDERQRKQYRYHPDWAAHRAETKFDRLIDFKGMMGY